MSPQELRWQDLFQKATLVKLHVKGWTGRVTLTPDDLGIPAEDRASVDAGLTLGRHKLTTPGALTRIDATEGDAEDVLKKMGITFPMMERTYFVPNDRLDEVKARLERAKRDREEAVEDFIAEYPDMQKEALPTLAEALVKVCKTEEAAIKALERVAAMYPDASHFRTAFTMSYSELTLASPPVMVGSEATKQITDTVRGMVESLRAKVTERMAEVSSLIRKNEGKVSQKTVKATLAILGEVRSLNTALGDQELARQVSVLERIMEGADENGLSLLPDITAATKALNSDLESATADAIENLTGFGNRRIG